MKKNRISTVGAGNIERIAAFLALLSFAALVFSAFAIINKKHFNVNNPFSISLICSSILFLVFAGLLITASCWMKNKEVTNTSLRKHFGHQQSTINFIFTTLSAVSLLATSLFLGVLAGKETSSFVSNATNIHNPLCIGLCISLAVLVASLLAYALKNMLAPERSNHLIILTEDDKLVSQTKHDNGANLLSRLQIDPGSLSSLEILSMKGYYATCNKSIAV